MLDICYRPLERRELKRLKRRRAGIAWEARKQLARWLQVSWAIPLVGFGAAASVTIDLGVRLPWTITGGITAVILLLAEVVGFFVAKRRAAARLGPFESALRRCEARVTHIQSIETVELEARTGAPACYAFQVDEDRIIMICGERYRSTTHFPNTDFVIMDFLDEQSGIVEERIEKLGVNLKPIRVIPAEANRKLRFAENLEILEGRLDDLERMLVR